MVGASGRTQQRRTVGKVDKFEAMLATGLAGREVMAAMMAEGFAMNEEEASALFEEISQNDTSDCRRGRRRTKMTIADDENLDFVPVDFKRKNDDSSSLVEIDKGEDKNILVEPMRIERSSLIPEVKNLVEETSPEAFFHALLRDDTTQTPLQSTESRTVRGSIASRMSDAGTSTSRRRRRTSSQPALKFTTSKKVDKKDKRTRSLAPHDLPSTPISPPLAEKIRLMQSEVPSRFKSEKRLLQENARAVSVSTTLPPKKNYRESNTLTVPESPALRTAGRSRSQNRTQDETTNHFFKALVLDPKVLQSSGDYGVPRVLSAPTTSPMPFAFATDCRHKQITARKPPPPSSDEIELAKYRARKNKRVSTVSARLLDQPRSKLNEQHMTATSAPCEEQVKPFKARPAPTNKILTFKPTPSLKPLTKPEAPKMPGLEIHAAARAKLDAKILSDEESRSRSTSLQSQRKPLASVAHELNSDRRARERKQYDSALAKRRKARELDKFQAEAAITKAKDAELKRRLRTSTTQGGLHFVARPVGTRSARLH